jgi:hypothetical protein
MLNKSYIKKKYLIRTYIHKYHIYTNVINTYLQTHIHTYMHTHVLTDIPLIHKCVIKAVQCGTSHKTLMYKCMVKYYKKFIKTIL